MMLLDCDPTRLCQMHKELCLSSLLYISPSIAGAAQSARAAFAWAGVLLSSAEHCAANATAADAAYLQGAVLVHHPHSNPTRGLPAKEATCSKHRKSGSRSMEPVDIMSRGPSRSCSIWSREGPDSWGLLDVMGMLLKRALFLLLGMRAAQRRGLVRGTRLTSAAAAAHGSGIN